MNSIVRIGLNGHARPARSFNQRDIHKANTKGLCSVMGHSMMEFTQATAVGSGVVRVEVRREPGAVNADATLQGYCLTFRLHAKAACLPLRP
ncbi:MAG: hypothetical protein ORN49_06985 [Rhodobacteraceae bacterium]|nr:hypothetical protein [Paracoccaceae bacterium]